MTDLLQLTGIFYKNHALPAYLSIKITYKHLQNRAMLMCISFIKDQ